MGFFSYYDRLGRLLPVSILFAAWVTVGFNILLMSLRAVSAISFSEPLMVITSGAEEDSALAIWKYIKNLPVFEDPHRLPFTASAYNWLYYAKKIGDDTYKIICDDPKYSNYIDSKLSEDNEIAEIAPEGIDVYYNDRGNAKFDLKEYFCFATLAYRVFLILY